MRRRTALAIAMLVAAVVAVPGTAGATDRSDDGRSWHRRWPTRTVQGTMTGPSGFRFLGCAGVVSWVGTGSYEARGLGTGTYELDVCVNTTPGPIEFAGDIVFTADGGSTLTGTVAGSFTGVGNDPGPNVTATLTDGTGRFARVRGELVLGPFVQSDHYNCNRQFICFDWTDTAPINGTLERVRHHCSRDWCR